MFEKMLIENKSLYWWLPNTTEWVLSRFSMAHQHN